LGLKVIIMVLACQEHVHYTRLFQDEPVIGAYVIPVVRLDKKNVDSIIY
jgi:hypothetical protein